MIFINYRNIKRSYAPMFIYRELARRFGDENVFQAGHSNLPGSEIPAEIMGRLHDCTVFVALIDPAWIQDQALLERPEDWVRREIVYAIDHGKEILPVLLDGVEMPKSRSLPGVVVPLTRKTALSMTTRSAEADLLRLVGEVERLAPGLVLASLTDLSLPSPTGPAALLRAEHQVFPWRHRPEFDRLAEWCQDIDVPRARLVTGPAGSGKTRLALQLAARLRGDGWATGLLSRSAPPAALDRLRGMTTRCLVILDDAEARPAQLIAALRALAADPGTSGRLLLLARSAGEWLDRLRDDPDDRVVSLIDALHPPMPLAPLLPADGDLGTALTTFAGRLRRPLVPMTSTPAAPAAPATLLELQAVALAHLLRSENPAEPLARILQLERRYWGDTASAFGLPDLGRREIAEIMAAVTLFGADTELEAWSLLATLRAFDGSPARVVDSCRELLRTLLPGTAALNPLQPDRLAEDAVADFLQSGGSLSGPIRAATDAQLYTALILLGRCLDRYPDLAEPVARFFAEAPGRLLPLAMTALSAVPRPELMAAQLARHLDALSPDQVRRLVDVLPQRSEALAQFAVVVTERSLAAGRAADTDGAETGRLARLLAVRLMYLGEYSPAIDAARMAVDQFTAPTIAESTEAASADDARRDPGLGAEAAEAIATLALVLDHGPEADAESLALGAQAISRYRALPASERRDAALAQALHHHSLRTARDNRLEPALAAAVEAYELTKPLDSARPASYRSVHMDVTDNLAVLMTRVGQLAAAERFARETVARRRALVLARADAYKPQLAGTLFNLGQILARQDGRQDEVRELWTESLALFSELADRWPSRFAAQYARVRGHVDGLGHDNV